MWIQNTDRQTDIHTYRHTYIHTDRQTELKYYIRQSFFNFHCHSHLNRNETKEKAFKRRKKEILRIDNFNTHRSKLYTQLTAMMKN